MSNIIMEFCCEIFSS